MGRAMFSKSLIQFSVDGCICVPSLLFTNYGGGNEDDGDLLQKVPCMHCCTQCPQPCSRPPLTHTSSGDSWTLMASLGQSLVGVTAPFSWVLVHTSSVCALQESVSQSCISSGGSKVGLMVTSSKRGLTLLHKTSSVQSLSHVQLFATP